MTKKWIIFRATGGKADGPAKLRSDDDDDEDDDGGGGGDDGKSGCLISR